MSVSYRQASKESIERAIAKCKAIKPHCRINGFNDFTVIGSKGTEYKVYFTGKGLDFSGHCQCAGSAKELVCYHVLAVAPFYKAQVQERAAKAALTAPVATDYSDLLAPMDMVYPAQEVAPALCCHCHTNPAGYDGICNTCFDNELYG